MHASFTYQLSPSRGLKKLAFCLILSSLSLPALAEWVTHFDNTLFYTDDVGLFSVTRRLSLEQDPTQPIVDEPNQGSDFVYEPNAAVAWKDENQLGEYELAVDAGAYVFFQQTAFTHGFFKFKLSQAFETGSSIDFFYDFVPNLMLGENEVPGRHGEESQHDERLDSHIWSLHFNQKITDSLNLRLLARYGLRDYDQPFTHRDTNFWTIGPHIQWEISPSIELLVGYHYEQGHADHQQNLRYHDDISYINHFFSGELKIELIPKLSVILIFDYEHNIFTSPYLDDIRYDGNENIYQGEIEFLYEINEVATAYINWQHGSRKFSFEDHDVKNNNVGIGLEYYF